MWHDPFRNSHCGAISIFLYQDSKNQHGSIIIIRNVPTRKHHTVNNGKLIYNDQRDPINHGKGVTMIDHENPQNVVSTLDVRGMVCSKPVIKIKVQLKKMQSSDTLEVLATENNYRDLERLFGEAQGHMVDVIHDGDVVKFLITKV